jgi:hypothetical protein
LVRTAPDCLASTAHRLSGEEEDDDAAAACPIHIGDKNRTTHRWKGRGNSASHVLYTH